MSAAATPAPPRARLRPLLLPAAVLALGLAGLVAALVGRGGEGSAPAPARAQAAIPLEQAGYALVAQRLQSELAAYAVLAEAIETHEQSHAASVQLRRHESALADVAHAAAGLAAGQRGETAQRAAALQALAENLHGRAVAVRLAAHSERRGDRGVLALRAFGAGAQITAGRLQSLLGGLAVADGAPAYAAALSAVASAIADAPVIEVPPGAAADGSPIGDDVVPG